MSAAPPPRTPGKVIASILLHGLDFLATTGLPVEEMKAEAGLRPEHLVDPAALVPITLMEDMLHSVLRRMPLPLMGLQASQHPALMEFGVLSFITRSSYTLGDVFDAIFRFEPLMGDLGHASLSREPGAAVYHYDCTSLDPLLCRHASEHVLGVWRGLTRLLHASRNPVLEIRFCHAPPEDTALLAVYQDIFRCPVLFRQPRNSMVLASHVMGLPLRHPNPALLETLEQHAREQLRQVQQHSLLEAARSHLRQLMAQGQASREALAEAMGSSSRHLARLLEQEGSGYRELLDELRLELARQYLADASQSVEAVALRLNFQESHSFIRWFRREAGVTPGEYRHRQATGEVVGRHL